MTSTPPTFLPKILIDHPNLDETLTSESASQSLKDSLVIASFQALSSPHVPPPHHKLIYATISYLATRDISIFCSAPVIESLSNILYGVVDNPKDVSLKRHSMACLLAAKLLYLMYLGTPEWPTRFAIAYVYDMCRYRFWAENHAVLGTFLAEVRTAFGIGVGEDANPNEPVTSRYNLDASFQEIYTVTEKEITTQINKCDPKLIIPLLKDLIRVPGLRLLGVANLDKWLNQPNYFRMARDFLLALPAHTHTLEDYDIQIVNAIAMMKVKPNMVPMFAECVARLVRNQPEYARIFMNRFVYLELQSTSITNTTNMTLMYAAFSGCGESPPPRPRQNQNVELRQNSREQHLGLVLRDIAASLHQQQGATGTPTTTNPMLNKVARRISKVLAPILDLASFSGWLLQEKDDMKQAPREVKERWLSQLAQILTTFCATVAVERGIPSEGDRPAASATSESSAPTSRSASVGLTSTNHSPSPVPGSATSFTSSSINNTPPIVNSTSANLTPITPHQQAVNEYQFRKSIATVNNVAAAWVFLSVWAVYLPDLPPDRVVGFVQHVLFLEPTASYAQVESQQEVRVMDYWFQELPCDENTFHQLAYAALNEGIIPAEQFYNIAHKLVVRAARLQHTLAEKGLDHRGEYNCLPIQTVELVRAVFLLCSYTPTFLLQQQVKPPPTQLWLRQYFWKACLINIVIIALNCDSEVGTYGWQLPTMNYLMKLLLTEQVHSIPETHPAWNLLPGEQESVDQYCVQMIDILSKLNMEHSFFQNGSIEKWVQLLTIPNEESQVRYPTPDAIHELAQLDKSLNLGTYLRRCRSPDFLLQIIQEKGSQESMPWLSDVLQREPSVLSGLPVGLLCEIMMQTLARRATTSPGSPETATSTEILQRIAVRLVTHIMSVQPERPESVSEMLIVIQFFLSHLADPQSELVQSHAQKALQLIFVENYRDEGEDAAEKENITWLQRLQKVPALLDLPQGRHRLASLFSAYIHHGSDANFMGALTSFVILRKLLSPVKISLDISTLFKNRPHFVAKLDWEKDDLLRLVTETFTTAYRAFKQTQNVPPHQQDIANTKLLVLGNGIKFRIYPLFLEGYLFLLTLLVSRGFSSNIEEEIIGELLAETTSYENGIPIVTPELARSFFSVEHPVMLQSALRTLKTEDPQSVLMALTSLKRGEVGSQQIREHFDSMNDEQLHTSLLSLKAHQMSVFMISLTHIEQFYPNFVQRVRRLLQEESDRKSLGESLLPSTLLDRDDAMEDEQHVLTQDDVVQHLKEAQISTLSSTQTDSLLSEMSIVSEPLLTLPAELIHNITTMLAVGPLDHTKQAQLMNLSHMNNALMRDLVSNTGNDLGLNTESSVGATHALLQSFYTFVLKETSVVASQSLRNILRSMESVNTDSNPALKSVGDHLSFIFTQMSHNALLERLFLKFISNKYSENDHITLLLECARKCTKERRGTIFEHVTSLYPSLNHTLIWQSFLFTNENTTEPDAPNHSDDLDFDRMRDLFIECARYEDIQNIISLLAEPNANHRHVLDIVLAVRSSMYSNYKYLKNTKLFPHWERAHMRNLVLFFVRELSILSQKHTKGADLLQELLREEQQSLYLSLLQEACTEDKDLLQVAVRHCESLIQQDSDAHVTRASQTLLSWLYATFPFALGQLENFAALKELPVPASLVSTLDKRVHRLCQYLRSRNVDPFMFQMLRMLSALYPNLVLKRFGVVEALLEFGYSTSIDQFIEKQLSQTYEQVLYILHALKPHLFRISVRQLHSVLERYFTIMRRLPSEQFATFSNFLHLLVDLLLAYKRESPQTATVFLNENEFVLTRIRSECRTMPQLLDKLHILTSDAHDSFLLNDFESLESSNEVDGVHSTHYHAILRVLQYKNPQHLHNSVEINAHNGKLIEVLTALVAERTLDAPIIKLLTQSMLRLCTAQDVEVRRLSYKLILGGVHLDPLNHQSVFPTYLKLFSHPDVEVRRHAIAQAPEFAPYAGEHTHDLLNALFEAENEGIAVLSQILNRMHPILS